MAAANTDLLKKVSRKWVGQIGSGGVGDAVATTIPLASATNLPTDTAVAVVIDRVDANGTKTTSLEETIIGVVSGTNLVTCTRGVEGTAQAHNAGAVVEVLLTADNWNDLVDHLLVGHNQDGTHKDLGNATASTVTASDVTATRAMTASTVTASDVTATRAMTASTVTASDVTATRAMTASTVTASDVTATRAMTASTVTASDVTATRLLDLSGGQVKFPATQVPSADANTLDDYEEGTWTPVLTFNTPGDVSISYTNQVGRYVKIGKMVIAYFFIYSTSFTHSTGSGNVKITGLPFTSADSCTGYMDWQAITKTNYTHFYPILIAGNTFLNIVGGGSGQLRAYVQAADMPSGGAPFLRGMIIYFV